MRDGVWMYERRRGAGDECVTGRRRSQKHAGETGKSIAKYRKRRVRCAVTNQG